MPFQNSQLKSSGNASKSAQGNKYITLKSLRNLRSWFKDASAQDVSDVIKQLEHLKREKLKLEEDQKSRNVQYNELWEHYANQGISARVYLGLDPQEVLDALVEHLSSNLRRSHSSRVKYRFFDLEGNLCEWSGQGREPRKLTQLLKSTGKSREEFLVKHHNNQAVDSNDAMLALSQSIDLKQSLYHKS